MTKWIKRQSSDLFDIRSYAPGLYLAEEEIAHRKADGKFVKQGQGLFWFYHQTSLS